MSRRRRADTGKMSLFPFLDVLVCTMGSLILLLLVATSRIRAAAVDKAKQAAMQQRLKSEATPVAAPEPIVLAPEPEPEPEVDPTPEWQTRVEQLTEERDALRNQLTQLKNRLATAQSAVMRTKVKAASTEDRLKAIRTQQEEAASERQRLQTEIDSLQSDLTDAEARLTKAVERQKTTKSKFAFMPFDGRTGTTKRPILIECTQDGIRFLPENVRLTLEDLDLQVFNVDANPVRSGSEGLVRYWGHHSTNTDEAASNESEPYLLLLVRPHGEVTFSIAKGWLSKLKVPHGYELITDEMEFELSEPDPEAKRICQQAISQTLANRRTARIEVDQHLKELQERDQQQGPLRYDRASHTVVRVSPNDSPMGFNRSRPSSPSPSSASAPLRSGMSPDVASPKSNRSASGVSASAQNNDSTSAEITSQNSAQAMSARQNSRNKPDDEPPEESLPPSTLRRYENDDTKPFPFSGERTKTTTSKESVSASSANKPSNSRPAPRTNNDPRVANNSTNGSASNGNLQRMKRRYLMPRSGIGLEKAITIRISSRRVVVGGDYEIPVDDVVKTESLIDRVLMAMNRVQFDWPSAGEGYHWVPTIKYEIVPGGEQVHQRLNSALFDLGLVSNVEYLESDPDAVKPSRETSRTRATTPAGGGVR